MATTIEQSRKAVKTKPAQFVKKGLDSGINEFNRDLERAISGDELVNRMSQRIYRMFENEGDLSARS
jgi:hypothetical protein